MSARTLGAIVLNEVRLRMRRLSTLVALLIVVALAWMAVPDPATGNSLIVVQKARLAYNGTVLGLGSSMLASLLFGLGGFYLARGRVREDLLYRTGAILAATPVSNALLIFARWLGAVAYLATLGFAVMLTMMVMWLVRGDGAFEPLAFVQMYVFLLLPTLCFAAGIAVLCDAFAPLMGKGGDVLYFVLWFGQFSMLPSTLTSKSGTLSGLSVFDFSGFSVSAHRMHQLFETSRFAIGRSPYDPALGVPVLTDFWTVELMGVRLLSLLLTLVPLLLAIALFHRYAPEKVKAVNAGKRFSILDAVNRLLRPAGRAVRPLFALAARMPGIAGQVLADLASTLVANPAAVVALPVLFVFGWMAGIDGLNGVLAAAVLCWGIVVSDLAVRDHQSATDALTAVVPGGMKGRYLRQYIVTAALGLVFAAPVLARWLVSKPLFAAALVTGVLALSAAAALLGKLTRTGRTFLGLFLFGLYLSSQIKGVPWFDAVGFNGAATLQSVGAYFVAAVLLGAAGYFYDTRKR
jgi:hypothetical protein